MLENMSRKTCLPLKTNLLRSLFQHQNSLARPPQLPDRGRTSDGDQSSKIIGGIKKEQDMSL